MQQRLDYVWRSVISVRQSLWRKSLARLTGESPLSRTCQIPNLRETYARLGLSPHSGTFVEIGAFDGEGHSNTSFLADQGWRGIYVEPVLERCTAVKLRHMLNNVTVEPVAASDTAGECEIRVMGALSTMDGETAGAYKAIRWGKKKASRATTRTIRTERLDTILTRNAVRNDVELMVIDVEGHELPIVEALMASPWRPKVLIVELVDNHPDFDAFSTLKGNALKARKLIVANGYQPVYADQVNTIFAEKRRPPG